jgi:hypothetical protein
MIHAPSSIETDVPILSLKSFSANCRFDCEYMRPLYAAAGTAKTSFIFAIINSSFAFQGRATTKEPAAHIGACLGSSDWLSDRTHRHSRSESEAIKQKTDPGI